jgi:hypothetical protein
MFTKIASAIAALFRNTAPPSEEFAPATHLYGPERFIEAWERHGRPSLTLHSFSQSLNDSHLCFLRFSLNDISFEGRFDLSRFDFLPKNDAFDEAMRNARRVSH